MTRLVPVPGESKKAFIELARLMGQVYRDHGAIRVIDYWQVAAPVSQSDFHAEETTDAEGQLRSLASAIDAAEAERVAVTVMEWPSKEARDRVAAVVPSQDRWARAPRDVDERNLVAHGSLGGRADDDAGQ